MIAHDSVCNLIAAQRQHFWVANRDRVLQFSSLSFDAATFEVLMALGSGATLVLANRDDLMPGAPLYSFCKRK